MTKKSRFSTAKSIGFGILYFFVFALVQGGFVYLAGRAPVKAVTVPVLALVACFLLIGAYRTGIRRVENRNVTELAARGALSPLLLGVLLGVAMFVLVETIILLSGHAQVSGFGSWANMLAMLGFAFAAAVGEEILFRGILFRLLEEAFGLAAALLVSSVIFGVLHAFNPAASWQGIVAISLEAGLLLGLAYALTRSLWLPIGIHLGWNFTQGGVFGNTVSGTEASGLVVVDMSASQVWTGGEFGPEASAPAVLVCLAVSGVFAAKLAQRHRENTR